MPKELKTELLTWAQRNYSTYFYRHGSKIKKLIDEMPHDMKLKQAKAEIERELIKLK